MKTGVLDNFSTHGERFYRPKAMVDVPGPGSYALDKDLNYVFKPFTSHPGGFVSADRRFRSDNPFTPGPG